MTPSSVRPRRAPWPCRLALSVCLLLALMAVPAKAAETTPQLSEAQAACVMDEAGNVLFEQNADEELPMASITKVMTAMVALDAGIDLDTPCTITEVDLGADSQTVGFTSTDTPTLRELIQAMLVYSGNDAAENVALNVAGSEEAFVALMNQKAQELGMTHTHFANPHGLEADGHYSCARDLVVMGREALARYPLIAQTVRRTSVTVSVAGVPTTLRSTDSLLSTYLGMRGIKTGSVASGTAFLGACRRDGTTLFTSVLGCSTSAGRFSDTVALLDWAWGTFEPRRMGEASWVLDVEPYALNFWWKVAVSLADDADVRTWPDGGGLAYRRESLRRGALLEPGQPCGSIAWSQDGRSLGTVRIVARSRLVRTGACGTFELPLWADAVALGREAGEAA